jgi:hypothetical protein
MPSARDGSARGVSGGGARLLDICDADQAEALPIAEYVARSSRLCASAARNYVLIGEGAAIVWFLGATDIQLDIGSALDRWFRFGGGPEVRRSFMAM